MAEKPAAQDDPVVSKSLAPHYVIAMVVLMATLFWALWDENFGQRQWKAFQQEWKTRYTAFLGNARSRSADSEKGVEGGAEYQTLKTAYDKLNQDTSRARAKSMKSRIDLSAKILAVQNIFTDRRAYVNALTYGIETETSGTSKQRQQKDLDKYKQLVTGVEFPDGSRHDYNYDQLGRNFTTI